MILSPTVARVVNAGFLLLALLTVSAFGATTRAPKTAIPEGTAWFDTSTDPETLRLYFRGQWVVCERTSLEDIFVCANRLVDVETGVSVQLPPEFMIEGDERPRE